MLRKGPAAIALLLCAACTRAPQPPRSETIALNNRGVGLMGTYDFERARDAFRAAAKQDPDRLDLLVNVAIATLNRRGEGDGREAQALLERVLARDPAQVRANYCLGLTLLDDGRPAEAAPRFETAARLRPRDAYAAYYVAQSLTQAGQPESALPWFERAAALDPRLRSAFYGAAQTLQRLRRGGEAQRMLDRFRALETDPRSEVAEFKYTRMGPLAEATTIDAPAPKPSAKPQGPIFADAVPLVTTTAVWRRGEGAPPSSITVADIDGDGRPDVFLAGAIVDRDRTRNAVLRNTGDGFILDLAHPLAGVTGVTAVLWGDIDNDGLLDAYLCRRGASQLWRQRAPGVWTDTTAEWHAGSPGAVLDGAMIDSDHDGDLDLLLVDAVGRDDLLNNNGDGTFRSLASQIGLAADGRPSRGIVVADLDGDRDADLIILKAAPPHEVLLNDRGWHFHRDPAFAALEQATIYAAVAADLDSDGRTEIYASDDDGLSRWTAGADGRWNRQAIRGTGPLARASQLALADVDGDGRLDLLVSTRTRGWEAIAVSSDSASVLFTASDVPLASWAVAMLDDVRGPSVIGLPADGSPPLVWKPGPGRWPFVTIAFSGRDSRSDQLRSNVSGIGVLASARADSRWTTMSTLRTASGPGQSLQPAAFGTGGERQIDFVSLTWSDGVLQTELALAPGPLHRIDEKQRQLSSCPVLFAFDGRQFTFVTDLLGVGGIGTPTSPGVYDPPRPRERVLVPAVAVAPRNGGYELRIDEPMEETAYVDSVSLLAYDVPPGWQIALDERKTIAGPPATGEARFFRTELLPVRATDDEGRDQTAALSVADGHAADPGRIDPRFIGRTGPHTLTLEFAHALDAAGSNPMLVADGWIEYPYAQTLFAAWQAHAPYEAPTVEARDATGRWRTVLREFGYPAGMPRRMTVPLPHLPAGTRALRIRTTQEIYWDRLAVAYAETCPVRVNQLPLITARIAAAGFARRATFPGRRPSYDYAHREPLWATRHARGFYTAEGTVTDLVAVEDGGLAIFGPGEELQLEFDARLAPPPAGWSRWFVLDARGWCKDMDLYTKDGDTVGPLPVSPAATEAGAILNHRYNTRYASGQ